MLSIRAKMERHVYAREVPPVLILMDVTLMTSGSVVRQ